MAKQSVKDFKADLEESDIKQLFNIEKGRIPKKLEDYLKILIENISIFKEIDINKIGNFEQFKIQCLKSLTRYIKNFLLVLVDVTLEEDDNKKLEIIDNDEYENPLEIINNILLKYDRKIKEKFNKIDLKEFDLTKGEFNYNKLQQLIHCGEKIIAFETDLKAKRNEVKDYATKIQNYRDASEKYMNYVKDRIYSKNANDGLAEIDSALTGAETEFKKLEVIYNIKKYADDNEIRNIHREAETSIKEIRENQQYAKNRANELKEIEDHPYKVAWDDIKQSANNFKNSVKTTWRNIKKIYSEYKVAIRVSLVLTTILAGIGAIAGPMWLNIPIWAGSIGSPILGFTALVGTATVVFAVWEGLKLIGKGIANLGKNIGKGISYIAKWIGKEVKKNLAPILTTSLGVALAPLLPTTVLGMALPTALPFLISGALGLTARNSWKKNNFKKN